MPSCKELLEKKAELAPQLQEIAKRNKSAGVESKDWSAEDSEK